MNVMKGKKYYVSIGYIDKKEHPEMDAKFIKSLIVHCRDGTVYNDEENDVTLPLMPVNQIQKKKDKFEFRFLFFPSKALWESRFKEELPIKYNIFGLFESSIEDGIENIKLINFYECKTEYDYYYRNKSRTVTFEVDDKKLTEEK